nr:hypothetical protein Iba_chr01aCG17430 [Ipomoea batatas]
MCDRGNNDDGKLQEDIISRTGSVEGLQKLKRHWCALLGTNTCAYVQFTSMLRALDAAMFFWNFMFIRSDLHQPQAWKYVLQESSMAKIGIEVRNGGSGVGVLVLHKGFLIAIFYNVQPFPFHSVHGSCSEINKLLADSLDIIVATDGDFNRGNCRVSSNGHVSGDPI